MSFSKPAPEGPDSSRRDVPIPRLVRRRLAAWATSLAFVAAAIGVLAWARRGPATTGAAVSPGHARMVARLARIAAQAGRTNPVTGANGIEALREQARAAVPGTEHAVRLNWRLGEEELRLGNNEAAVAALTRADALGKDRMDFAAFRYALRFQLGLAYMRMGEAQNCVDRHSAESCLLPIRGTGVHQAQEGSRKAIEMFTGILDVAPDYLPARWLLNVAYMTVGEHPESVPAGQLIPPETFDSDEPFPRFRNVAPGLGLSSRSLAGGAIVDDFDGDERFDIVTSTMDPSGQLRCFHQEGDGTFRETTSEAGLEGILGALNIVQADYDNDGNLDILMLRGGWMWEQGRWPKSLLRGHGDGTFSDVTLEAGLARVNHPTMVGAWADYDLDGDLDLFVGNEVHASPRGDGSWEADPCELFENNGNGTFTDVAPRAGVENLRYTKGATWGDYDGDRLPDLYVSNLGGENRLYHNEGDGTFVDVAPSLGVTGPRDSFATWFWDFDNDGALDIFVNSYWQASGRDRVAAAVASQLGMPTSAEHSALYRGDGRGGFTDVTAEQGLERVTFAMGCNFGDLDDDGHLDFYLGTGFPDYAGILPNVMYRNRGGSGFSDVTTAGGFGHLQKGHGVAFADLDGDGDQDVFEQMGGAFPGDAYSDVLYENPGFSNSWLEVRLVGSRSNRCAIGARIRVVLDEGSGERSITRWVTSGGSFGANPLRQHFGLGKAPSIAKLEVYWPMTGETEAFENVAARRVVSIVEGEGNLAILDLPPAPFAISPGATEICGVPPAR